MFWGRVNEQVTDALKVANNLVSLFGVPVNLGAVTKYLGFEVWMPKHTLPEEISGFVTLVDSVIIVVNGDMHYHRRRFTLAHEIWHGMTDIVEDECGGCVVIYRRETITDSRERLANIFATELLMPAEHVLRLWKSGVRDVKEYSRFFLVSRKTAEVRLFAELGLPRF